MCLHNESRNEEIRVGTMRIPIDISGSMPIYRQIQSYFEDQISAGKLPAGVKLPATRLLASRLGVSRITVMNAYAELAAEGLVVGRPGSGTYVADSPTFGTRNPAKCNREGTWPLWQRSVSSNDPADDDISCLIVPEMSGTISFASGYGDPELIPIDDLCKAARGSLRRNPVETFAATDPRGYLPLRRTISSILAMQGIPVHPDEVLVTSGSQQAISLIARLLVEPGDVVIVEEPTFVGALNSFRRAGARLIGIPLDENGMKLDMLESIMRKLQPALIYTIPTFHNPTGVCMSENRRLWLVELAERYSVPILEDDFAGDLSYGGRSIPPIKALDQNGDVLYISTFSKIIAPGLRLGYLVASGPVLERLVRLKQISDVATSTFIQRTFESFISVGRYYSHIQRLCRIYGDRRDALVEALERAGRHCWDWRSPEGGFFLWLEMCDRIPPEILQDAMYAHGVSAVMGAIFFTKQPDTTMLRLNFAALPPLAIGAGVERLQRAVTTALSGLENGHKEFKVPCEAIV